MWIRSSSQCGVSGMGARGRVYQAISNEECSAANSKGQIHVSKYLTQSRTQYAIAACVTACDTGSRETSFTVQSTLDPLY